MKNIKSNKGFTLVELLITVVIIGILAAVLLPKFSSNTDKARTIASLSSLKSLGTAVEVYIVDGGSTAGFGNGGIMVAAEKEAMITALAAAGKIVINGTAADEAARFTAYALADAAGVVTQVAIMQYRSDANDPYVVNGDRTVAATLLADADAAGVTSPSDYVGLKGANSVTGEAAWPTGY